MVKCFVQKLLKNYMRKYWHLVKQKFGLLIKFTKKVSSSELVIVNTHNLRLLTFLQLKMLAWFWEIPQTYLGFSKILWFLILYSLLLMNLENCYGQKNYFYIVIAGWLPKIFLNFIPTHSAQITKVYLAKNCMYQFRNNHHKPSFLWVDFQTILQNQK